MALKKKTVLRFKGFTDDWEQRKFFEIAQRESNMRLSSSDFPSVEYEDVVSEAGVLNKNIRAKGTQKTGIIFDGSQILYGKLRPYLHNWLSPDFNGVAVGDWWVLRPIETNKDFLYRLIQTQKFDDIANQSSGSKMPRADWNLIANTMFMIPTSITEQRKIGTYFNYIDNLITLHQRKYAMLKKIKKSFLEKMFPKNGKRVPELRFSGFTDDWEQRKLGELTIEFKSGKGIKANEIEARGTYPVYGGNGLRGYAEQYNHDGEYALIGRQGALCGNMTFSMGKAYFTEHAVAVKANEINDTKFLYYILGNMNLGQYSGQSAQPGLAVNKLIALKAFVPGKQEQLKISSYLGAFDNLITLHQRKLEKLQNLKKALLKKMFI